jgi:hypothetical protein
VTPLPPLTHVPDEMSDHTFTRPFVKISSPLPHREAETFSPPLAHLPSLTLSISHETCCLHEKCWHQASQLPGGFASCSSILHDHLYRLRGSKFPSDGPIRMAQGWSRPAKCTPRLSYHRFTVLRCKKRSPRPQRTRVAKLCCSAFHPSSSMLA